MSGFIAPVLNYAILAPILIVLGGALVAVLVEAFASRTKRASLQLGITLITLLLLKNALISILNLLLLK